MHPDKKRFVKTPNTYTINFSGLSIGEHVFNWEIDGSFFEDCDYPEIIDAKIFINCLLNKSNNFMELDFECKGNIGIPCDRCLDKLILKIDTNRKIIVKESEQKHSDNDDIFFVSRQDYEISVADWIREMILLSIPMRNVHLEGQCNPEMIDKLGNYMLSDENES